MKIYIFLKILCIFKTFCHSFFDPISNTSTSVTRSLETSSFHVLLRKYEGICGTKSNNKVLNRNDGANEDLPKEERDWSLHSNAMKQFFDTTLPYCHSTEDIIQSVDASISLDEKKCRIRWLNHEAICRVLSLYASVEFIGDSLTRHMNAALTIILTGNLEYGAYNLTWHDLTQEEIDSCRCDGQFSESRLCRLHCVDRIGLNVEEFRKLHQCSAAVTLNVNCEFATNVCAPSPATTDGGSQAGQLRFLMIQGGTWKQTDPAIFYNEVKGIMNDLKEKLNRCEENHKSSTHYRIVFTGVPIVSGAVEKNYPLQTKARAISFYEEMTRLLKTEYPSIVAVSFLNLTEYAAVNGYTSDGFHQLTDQSYDGAEFNAFHGDR